jgi:PncC family amidohydrolase
MNPSISSPDFRELALRGADLLDRARRKGLKIACAESCTGGLIGAVLTETPGSSDVFLGSAVTYSNEAKQRLLGVPLKELDAFGAVSEAVARSMARGAREAFGADLAVAVTGVAGPDGGSREKPVGTVWLCVVGPGGAETVRALFPGDRPSVRMATVARALVLLERAAEGAGGSR